MKTISKLALGLLASITVTAATAQVPQVKAAPPAPQVAPVAQPAEAKKDVTRADVLAKASKRFESADTDKNGVLSAEERKAAREKFREMHRKDHHHRSPRGERPAHPPHGDKVGGKPMPQHDGLPTIRPAPSQGAPR